MKKQFCVKTLILCLCVFFVCTAFADQKDRQADIYRLRSKPQVLSEDDVRDMIRKHNFYSRVSFIMGKKWQNKSGSFRNDFTDNINGTVTDSVTGLMWQKSGSDNGMPYDKAQAYIDGLNRRKFAGYSDWRFPTLEELASLLENKEINGRHIDPLFDRKQWWCWSADKRASGGGAWLVYFIAGGVRSHNFESGYCVRAVRSLTIDENAGK